VFALWSKCRLTKIICPKQSLTSITKTNGPVCTNGLIEIDRFQNQTPDPEKVLDDAFVGKETANFEFALFTKDNNRVEVSRTPEA